MERDWGAVSKCLPLVKGQRSQEKKRSALTENYDVENKFFNHVGDGRKILTSKKITFGQRSVSASWNTGGSLPELHQACDI